MKKEKNEKNQISSLSKEQRKKREQLISNMETTIQNLEFEIQEKKGINRKNKRIKNIKMASKRAMLFGPYILIPGCLFCVLSFGGATPFYRDEQKQYLETMKEIDSGGNVYCEQQYQEYKDTESTISYYEKWNLDKEGKYFRNVQVYSVNDLEEEKLIDLVNQNKNSILNELFGEPIISKMETKNNLSEEELSKAPFLQARIYDKSKEDYILIEESMDNEILSIITWVSVSILTLMLNLCRIEIFNFSEYIEQLEKRYPSLDVDHLQKKLEIKKNNYNRLVRK